MNHVIESLGPLWKLILLGLTLLGVLLPLCRSHRSWHQLLSIPLALLVLPPLDTWPGVNGVAEEVDSLPLLDGVAGLTTLGSLMAALLVLLPVLRGWPNGAAAVQWLLVGLPVGLFAALPVGMLAPVLSDVGEGLHVGLLVFAVTLRGTFETSQRWSGARIDGQNVKSAALREPEVR